MTAFNPLTEPMTDRTTKTCATHGEYTTYRMAGVWAMCPACYRAQIDEIRVTDLSSIREERRRDRAKQLLAIANVPARYEAAALASLTAPQAQKIRAFVSAMASSSGSMLMLGDIGAGKTHAACALIREACDAGIHARYCRTFDLATRIRDTWGNREQESAALDWFREPRLLVIDEIGLGTPNEADAQRLHDLIDYRYNAAKATVLVSNLGLEALRAYLGARAADRMREGLVTMAFRGESRRQAGGL